tara:strand:- start:548 stop:814 length:267 start_codon:yes stop_codon:yes gene_type:complete
MKVKIMQRSVYHKYAEIEVEIPNTIKEEDVQPYLIDNEDLYTDKIDEKLSKAEYVHGTGLYDFDGMEDAESDSEWRYEIIGQNYGGHL